MYPIAVVIAVLAVMLVLSVYSSFSMFLFVEGAIYGGITCSPQGNGKTYCCASVSEKDDILVGTTYCTTCDDTNPPSNCTEREKPLLVVNPGKVLSNVLEGGILEEPNSSPKLGEDVFPKGGGVLEQPENNMTFSRANVPFPLANDSDDNTNNTLVLQQSDVENDTAENNTGEMEAEAEEDETEETGESNEEEE